MAFQDTVVHGLPLTRESFAKPPLEMGIIPFWFWNGELDYDEMRWQLRQYHDKGVRSLFIHGRMGLSVPYLSDEWFERVKFVVADAKEVGIDIWVYDEMDWPSGTAQKQVIEKYPHVAQRYLDLVALHINGPLFTFLEAHDSRYVNTGPASPVAAFGVRTEEFYDGIRETVDLTKNLSFERTIPWEAPAGKWTLMYFLEKEAPWYIDTLNPEATERFLELTHEKYKAAVGDEFGKTVPGFYTDEPAMYYFQVGLQNHVVPWSRQMFKIFRERRGYDLKPFLPALYTQMGSQTAQVRYDFWHTLTEQYEECYYKRIADWCHDNGTLFTGHLLFEDLLRLQARCEGNLFKYLRHMDVIGVDHLYPKVGTPGEPQPHVALKIGSSAAHHFGSKRLLCESMGGTYWDCTLERMKWMANWEYVLGVNLFNNHGYHYSIEGERKRDWPPSQFYHHPWWDHYPEFTNYMARLSHLLTGGHHVAKLLVLYPITSIWTNFMPQEHDVVSKVIERDFNHLTDALLRLHHDFDYVDEDVLAEATVEDGKIRIRDEEFEVLILPPVTHIKPSTFARIQELVDGGGSVIATTLLPVHFMEAGSAAPLSANGEAVDFAGFFGQDPVALLERFSENDPAPFEVHHRTGANGKGNIIVITGPGLGTDTDPISQKAKTALDEAVRKCITPDVTISDPDVFYLHRVNEDFDLYFFANTTQVDRGCVEITFERVGRPEFWDSRTGKISPISVYDIRDGRLSVSLDFPPSESRVVVIRDGEDERHVTDTNLSDVVIEDGDVAGFAGGDEEVFAEVSSNGSAARLTAKGRPGLRPISLPAQAEFAVEHDNALLIGTFKMRAIEEEGVAPDGFEQPEFDDSAWLDVTNGAWEMQLPMERDEAVYPVYVQYRTSFEVRHIPGDPRIMIDGFRGSSFRLFLNGHEIEERGQRSKLDAEIREVDVRRYLREGRNVVALEIVATKRTDGLLDLIKLVGDFALEEIEDDRFSVMASPSHIEMGTWTKQGYPFFSGTGVYRFEVDVPDDYLGGRLLLEAELGEDVLAVSVNENDPQVAPWHPYRLDLTEHIRSGKNSIELKVTNTLLNILEGKPLESGLTAAPRLVHEHRYVLTGDENQP